MKGVLVNAPKADEAFYRELGFVKKSWKSPELDNHPDPASIIQMQCKWR